MFNFNQQVAGDSIVSFKGVVLKEDLLNKFEFERNYCKKHYQSNLWCYYNYQTQRLEFADKKAQFRAICELWKAQGFKFTKRKDKPEFAKAIGARAVIGHVYQNPMRNEHNSEGMTEPLSTMMGYINAGNEVVTWEIVW